MQIKMYERLEVCIEEIEMTKQSFSSVLFFHGRNNINGATMIVNTFLSKA